MSLTVDDSDFVQHSDVMRTLLLRRRERRTIGSTSVRRADDIRRLRGARYTYEELLTHNPDFDYSAFHTGTLKAFGPRSHASDEARGCGTDRSSRSRDRRSRGVP